MLRLAPFDTRGTSSDDKSASYLCAVKKKKTKKKRIIMTKQRAFVFIKPHACVPKNDNNLLYKQKLVETFTENGCEVIKEGKISSSVIEKRKLIDAHYYAIASKATLLKPSELNVPEDVFQKTFGITWKEALEKNLCFNALDACKELNVDSAGLEKRSRVAKRSVKFGGGFYCAEMLKEDGTSIYVFNAFFMSMRSQFVEKGKQIKWFVVEFDDETLKWEDFRAKVLGPTDPKKAPETSLRGILFKNWKKYGLVRKPTTGENGVHASASPFEALAEIANWTGEPVDEQAYGKLLIQHGITKETLEMWGKDPQVNIRNDGLKGSLFDQVEDMDSKECMKNLMQINKLNEPAPPPQPVVTKSSSSKKKQNSAAPPTPKKTTMGTDNGDAKALIGVLVVVGLTLLAGGNKKAAKKEDKNAKATNNKKNGKK